MEAKHLQVVPSSHNKTSGGGPQKKIDMGQGVNVVLGVKNSVDVVVVDVGVMVKEEDKKNKESSSSLSSCVVEEIDFGVSVSDTAETETHSEEERAKKAVIKACQKQNRFCFSLFTEAQRSELDHQVLIFNHFAYNIPLPHNFVLPFLNTASGSATSSGSNFHKHKQFPIYMSEARRPGFDYGTMVDLEPHRCRRTDGKKWRCGKNVVPNQKYCERHMHRGRNRSRKPVETSEVNSPSVTKCSSKLHTMLASETESDVLSPKPLSIHLVDALPCSPSKTLSSAKTSSTNSRLKHIIDSAAAVSPGSTIDTEIVPKVTKFGSRTSAASDNRSNLNICKKDYRTKSCISNNISDRNRGKGRVTRDSNCISNGIGFSPRSVLQGNIVSGCNSSYLNDRNNIDLDREPGRCRRTDGKKWRCKSAVLPGQKYCATHMHRGAKRRFADHEPVAAAAASINGSLLPSSVAMKTGIQKANCAIPNTNLCMSIPASEELKRASSSSDTDTTITDTNMMNEYSYASF